MKATSLITLRGDSSANVPDDHRVTEAEAEEVRGVDARVEARGEQISQITRFGGPALLSRFGLPSTLSL